MAFLFTRKPIGMGPWGSQYRVNNAFNGQSVSSHPMRNLMVTLARKSHAASMASAGLFCGEYYCDLKCCAAAQVCMQIVLQKCTACETACVECAGKRLPLGKVGSPEDAAECYLYCMKAGFTTGSSIVADGGQCLLSL